MQYFLIFRNIIIKLIHTSVSIMNWIKKNEKKKSKAELLSARLSPGYKLGFRVALGPTAISQYIDHQVPKFWLAFATRFR